MTKRAIEQSAKILRDLVVERSSESGGAQLHIQFKEPVPDNIWSLLEQEISLTTGAQLPNTFGFFRATREGQTATLELPLLSKAAFPLRTLMLGLQQEDSALGESFGLFILFELCNILARLHRTKNLIGDRRVHGAITPDTVILQPSGEVTLLGPGMPLVQALLIPSFHDNTRFLSPEAQQGKVLDTRADIFSLTALYWEMVTGKTLERESTQALGDGLPDPRKRLLVILNASLSEDLKRRPKSTRALYEALEDDAFEANVPLHERSHMADLIRESLPPHAPKGAVAIFEEPYQGRRPTTPVRFRAWSDFVESETDDLPAKPEQPDALLNAAPRQPIAFPVLPGPKTAPDPLNFSLKEESRGPPVRINLDGNPSPLWRYGGIALLVGLVAIGVLIINKRTENVQPGIGMPVLVPGQAKRKIKYRAAAKAKPKSAEPRGAKNSKPQDAPSQKAESVAAKPVSMLSVMSTPLGATVVVDGELAGKTPLVLKHRLADKDYSLEIRKKGYRRWRKVLRPDPEKKSISVIAKLKKK